MTNQLEEAYIAAHYGAMTYNEIAQECTKISGIPRSGEWVRDKWRRNLKAKNDPKNSKKPLQPYEEGRQIETLTEKLEKTEKILNMMNAVEKKSVKEIVIKSQKSMGETTAFAIASDWHFEETVDGETINQLNNYNLKIAEQRAIKFFQKTALMVKISQDHHKINTLVLGLLGDMITGYIHEELEENNQCSPTEALLLVRDVIINGIKFLVKELPDVKIIMPCCIGNHGRTTKKRRISTGHKNSFEWLFYEILLRELKMMGLDKKVDVQVAKGYHLYLKVYDFTIRFHHGDNIQYGGGIGGITIPVKKAIAQWNKSKHADLDIFGHYHQLISHKDFICNGSLIGYNAYAESIKAEYEPPQQAFFLFHKGKGKGMCGPLWVD